MNAQIPQNASHITNIVLSCIDLSGCEAGKTLYDIISDETNAAYLTPNVVKGWLQGLPSTCSIPFYDCEVREILAACGKDHWSVDDYWNWAARRVLGVSRLPHRPHSTK